jgi:predicted ATP-grasp superfamily ATP-dependent carboligase
MTESPRKILVTSGKWQAALACVQSYGRAGHEVYLFDPDPDVPLGRSRYCAGVIRAPKDSQAEYRNALIRTLENGGFDLMVPISDDVVDVVADYQDDIRKLCRIEVAAPESLALARNKAATCQFAESKGILTPKTYYPATIEETQALSRSIDYPCVAKFPRGTSSLGVRICHSASDLLDFFQSTDSADNWPIVQDYVPGDIYDITAICNRGEVVAYFTFYSPLAVQVGGTPPYAFTYRSPEFLETAFRVLRELRWHGAIDLDFLRGPDGKFYLLEINPRLSGTVNMAQKLGIDLPRAYFDVAFGNTRRNYQVDYDNEILFRNVLTAELKWLKGDPPRRAWLALKYALRYRNRTNIYWRDWPLIWSELKQGLAELSKSSWIDARSRSLRI